MGVVMALTETELKPEIKERFGVMVEAPLILINYRAMEESVKGIEQEIKKEAFLHRRERLLKIRSDLKRILNEL